MKVVRVSTFPKGGSCSFKADTSNLVGSSQSRSKPDVSRRHSASSPKIPVKPLELPQRVSLNLFMSRGRCDLLPHEYSQTQPCIGWVSLASGKNAHPRNICWFDSMTGSILSFTLSMHCITDGTSFTRRFRWRCDGVSTYCN